MIHASAFVGAAAGRGFALYAGVPCSFLTPFINYVIGADGLDYVSSANEGDAVATAAGAWIGGRRGVAMMQNSGLGNAVSPLTSLTHTFRVPVLVVCTHRGAPGVSDEPQHELMGTITGALFDTMQIPWQTFPRETQDIERALDAADAHFTAGERPYALVMQKGTCEPCPLPGREPPAARARAAAPGPMAPLPMTARPARRDVLAALLELTADERTVLIATTGFTGRELYALEDRPNHLYMVGSMGCASSLGLGLALARPDLRVVVIDGDGAALMRMGNLATAGAWSLPNYHHLLLDNEAHDSTGAQATVSAHTDFAAIAAACGYTRVLRDAAYDDCLAPADGATFAHLRIRTGALDPLPRPDIAPADVLRRLRAHIGD